MCLKLLIFIAQRRAIVTVAYSFKQCICRQGGPLRKLMRRSILGDWHWWILSGRGSRLSSRLRFKALPALVIYVALLVLLRHYNISKKAASNRIASAAAAPFAFQNKCCFHNDEDRRGSTCAKYCPWNINSKGCTDSTPTKSWVRLDVIWMRQNGDRGHAKR